MDIVDTSSYRRLPIGITSWPPGSAAADKIRSGLVTHVAEKGSRDLLKMTSFDLQAITTGTASVLRVMGLDILPVADGYFAVESIKESQQTAIQQGEVLVMDGISTQQGGYITRRSADDGTENVNMSPTVPIHGSPLEFLPNKENVISFLADQWNSNDEAGQYQGTVEFNAWIEYEPRFIFV